MMSVPRQVRIFQNGAAIGCYCVPQRITTWNAFKKWLRDLRVIRFKGKMYSKRSHCAKCGHVDVE